MRSKLIWITGLSGAGKSTVAKLVYDKVKLTQLNTILLDGDLLREVFGNELGHSEEDRIKNAWRIVNMCKLCCDQNINVICSTMSLYKEIHSFIYNEFSNPNIFYLDVDMKELHGRNQKNLYQSGAENVIGVNMLFDRPYHEKYVTILKNNSKKDLEENVEIILGSI